jgi:hypothetical protein
VAAVVALGTVRAVLLIAVGAVLGAVVLLGVRVLDVGVLGLVGGRLVSLLVAAVRLLGLVGRLLVGVGLLVVAVVPGLLVVGRLLVGLLLIGLLLVGCRAVILLGVVGLGLVWWWWTGCFCTNTRVVSGGVGGLVGQALVLAAAGMA